MIFVIFFRFLASAVRKFLKLRPLQWRNGEFDKVNHQVERQPSTSTRHLPNIKKIVRAVFQTAKIYLFVSLKENHPLQHFIRVLTQEKKHVRNFISKLTSFLQKLEISHYNLNFHIIVTHFLRLSQFQTGFQAEIEKTNGILSKAQVIIYSNLKFQVNMLKNDRAVIF